MRLPLANRNAPGKRDIAVKVFSAPLDPRTEPQGLVSGWETLIR